MLAGTLFLDGDLVEYDPIGNVVVNHIIEGTIFTGANQDIDALHALANGNILLSLRTNGNNSTVGGLFHVFADEISTAAGSLLLKLGERETRPVPTPPRRTAR